MVLTLALIPAFSLRRRRIVPQRFEMSCGGDWRSVIEQTENGRWLFPLLGERVRVREVVKSNLSCLDVRRQHLLGVKWHAAFTQRALEAEEIHARHLGRRNLADAPTRKQRTRQFQAKLCGRHPLVVGQVWQFKRHAALLLPLRLGVKRRACEFTASASLLVQHRICRAEAWRRREPLQTIGTGRHPFGRRCCPPTAASLGWSRIARAK